MKSQVMRKSSAPVVLSFLALALWQGVLWVRPASAQVTFTNNNPIVIPALGVANPYPSNILVSGYTGTITGVRVTLTGLTHTATDDIGALFVGPGGQTTLLFDGPGSGFATNLNLTFSDSAATVLSNTGTIVLGTYLPGQSEYGSYFDPPVPNVQYKTNFNDFNGLAPNGSYQLFLQDFSSGDAGILSSWSVTLLGVSPAVIPEPASLPLFLCGGVGMAGVIVRRSRKKHHV